MATVTARLRSGTGGPQGSASQVRPRRQDTLPDYLARSCDAIAIPERAFDDVDLAVMRCLGVIDLRVAVLRYSARQ